MLFDTHIIAFKEKLRELRQEDSSMAVSVQAVTDEELEENKLQKRVSSGGIAYMISDFIQSIKDSLPQKAEESIAFLIDAHQQGYFAINTDWYKGGIFYSMIVKETKDDLKTDVFEFLQALYPYRHLSAELDVDQKLYPKIIVDAFHKYFPESDLAKMFVCKNVSEANQFCLLHYLGLMIENGNFKMIFSSELNPFFSQKEVFKFHLSLENDTQFWVKEGLWKAYTNFHHAGEFEIYHTQKILKYIFPNEKKAKVVKDISEEKDEKTNLIAPKDIPVNELHYEEDLQQNLDDIKDALKNIPIQNWIKRNSLKVMLHGESGAGKTAFVAQLCRELGFYQFSVGSLSSKWVGETEKNIRDIFEREYPRLMKKYKGKVILCIDEFDGVAGTKVAADSATANHHNSVVSQLLNSLDNFKGIMFVTLNNASPERIEPAIMRRFVFDFSFDLPSKNARKEIWRAQDGFWSGDEQLLEKLSEYVLTGAEINSISQKSHFLKYMNKRNQTSTADLIKLVESQVERAKRARYNYTKLDKKTIGFEMRA